MIVVTLIEILKTLAFFEGNEHLEMISLIKKASELSLSYVAESKFIYNSLYPSYVFEEGTSKFFQSPFYKSNEWWQMMFSVPVLINSYFITTVSYWGCKLCSWIINVSLDNKTWKTVDTIENKNPGGNTDSFQLSAVVPCSFFRIVFKETISSDSCVAFTNFDCFGKLASNVAINNCSCMRRGTNGVSASIILFICLIFY